MTDRRFQVFEGDCLAELEKLRGESIDLAYLDPPFFTNRDHTSVTRDRTTKFSFRDVWEGFEDYSEFISARVREIRRVLKPTGSIFVHCDSSANFLLRVLLDRIFGSQHFQAEIVWTYKRWSNSTKGLMPAHQTILFYSKTDAFKFNKVYGAYSETTNIDQILQLRGRDKHGVSSYASDSDGNVIFAANKKGVPLSDVWEIPFLNPKAKERVGYPTQKPILLLERILSLCTDPGDTVLDPFCGSGTTLVAAKLLGRHAIGVDCSTEAVNLTRKRLLEPVKTESTLLKKGRSAYLTVDEHALAVLSGVDMLPVQRNSGIDAFLRTPVANSMVPLRVQRKDESLTQAASKLTRAAMSKKSANAILIRTHTDEEFFSELALPSFIKVIDATSVQVAQCVTEMIAEIATNTAANKTLPKTALPSFTHQGRG